MQLIDCVCVISRDLCVGINLVENHDSLLQHEVHLGDLLTVFAVLDCKVDARLDLSKLGMHFA